MDKSAPFAHDEPVDLERDAFGHADYVRALLSMVTDKEAPSTIGVFGPWGVGKSTIIGGLQEGMPKGTAFAYFDAWRYEEDSLRRQFLRDVAGHLEEEGHLRKSGKKGFTVDENLKELDVDSQTVDENLEWSWERAKRALSIALPLGVVVLVLLQLGTGDFLSTDKFGQRILAALLVAVVTFGLNLFGHVFRIAETRITTPSLQDPDRFAATFSDLLGALKPKRLVIAVDNLDRCDAEKAVEMLSTIKTYLEPTVGAGGSYPVSRAHEKVDREIVFVISVDDVALKRHLIAQELEHSKELDRSTEQRVEAARRYVDEYLSKFFSARLPIRRILPDDIRGYVNDNLDPLIKGRAIEDDRKLLVEFVSAGLRRNPRRVKQFVNDLEARLRLLQEREKPGTDGKPGISSAVSEEVLPVARLALIEAEWPEAFEELQKDYRKLDEWEAEAKSEPAVWIRLGEGAEVGNEEDEGAEVGNEEDEGETPSSQPDPAELAKAQRFAQFLRISSSVSSENLRTLLDLKQAPAEAELPRFSEFRSAVVSDDRPEVERLVAEASSEERRGYAQRMKTILEEDLEAGYQAGARSVVDAMVQVSDLQEFAEERKEVLSTAVKNPALGMDQLAELDPGPLLSASRELEAEDRGQLIDEFVVRFVTPGVSAEEGAAIAKALAPLVAEISPNGKNSIQQALQGDLGSHFSIYRELIEADPHLLPPGIGQSALEALSETNDEGQSTLELAPDAVAVARIALEREENAELDDLFVQRVGQTLLDTKEVPASFGFNVTNGLDLLTAVEEASEPTWGQLADHIRDIWAESPLEHRKPLFELFELALAGSEEGQRPSRAQTFVTNLLSQPNQGIELLRSLDENPGDHLREPLIAELVQVGGQHEQERDEAVGLLRKYAGDEAAASVGTMVFVAIQHGHEAGAVDLLETYKDLLGSSHQQIAEQVLTWAEANQDNASLSLLVLLAPAINDEQKDRLATLFLARFRAADDSAHEALVELDQNSRARDAERTILRQAITFMASGPGNPTTSSRPFTRTLSAVAPYLFRLDKEGQEELGNVLIGWLDSHLRAETASEIQRMGGSFRADVVRPVVGKLIEIDLERGDLETRVSQLEAARSLSSESKRATSDLEAHYEVLRGDTDDDRAVLGRLGIVEPDQETEGPSGS